MAEDFALRDRTGATRTIRASERNGKLFQNVDIARMPACSETPNRMAPVALNAATPVDVLLPNANRYDALIYASTLVKVLIILGEGGSATDFSFPIEPGDTLSLASVIGRYPGRVRAILAAADGGSPVARVTELVYS